MLDQDLAVLGVALCAVLIIASVIPAPARAPRHEAGLHLALLGAGAALAILAGVLALAALPAHSAVCGALAWLTVMPCVWMARGQRPVHRYVEEDEDDDDGGGESPPRRPGAPPSPLDRRPEPVRTGLGAARVAWAPAAAHLPQRAIGAHAATPATAAVASPSSTPAAAAVRSLSPSLGASFPPSAPFASTSAHAPSAPHAPTFPPAPTAAHAPTFPPAPTAAHAPTFPHAPTAPLIGGSTQQPAPAHPAPTTHGRRLKPRPRAVRADHRSIAHIHVTEPHPAGRRRRASLRRRVLRRCRMWLWVESPECVTFVVPEHEEPRRRSGSGDRQHDARSAPLL